MDRNQYLCDFIHVLIFVTVSKWQKSPKLTNIVIQVLHLRWTNSELSVAGGRYTLQDKKKGRSNARLLSRAGRSFRNISGLVFWFRQGMKINVLLSSKWTYLSKMAHVAWRAWISRTTMHRGLAPGRTFTSRLIWTKKTRLYVVPQNTTPTTLI